MQAGIAHITGMLMPTWEHQEDAATQEPRSLSRKASRLLFSNQQDSKYHRCGFLARLLDGKHHHDPRYICTSLVRSYGGEGFPPDLM
jgi:hypothetical protein